MNSPTSATHPLSSELLVKAAKIKLLLMDVDGVLTDGRVLHIPHPSGELLETKAFDSQDGIALQWLSWYGIPTGIISGRVSPVVDLRVKQGKMRYNYQGHIEKIPILEEILADAKVSKDEVGYIGDDLTDVVVMRRVGVSFAVANARPEVKQIADYTTLVPGGSGALREVTEVIFRAKGWWDEILKKYEVLL